ncbi:MAG: sulfite exporter TauE/SafE family protein [Kiritimatiellae bacterium]|nr:sulfite exporter TauE/SafE family protein [Kiritimatiellia bacterium]
MKTTDTQRENGERSEPHAAGRRARIWALLVLAIVLVFGVRILVPGFMGVPGPSASMSGYGALLVLLAALVCEYVDSSLGMGYGTTLTPLLLLAGFEPLQIVPCVLVSECLTGLSAAFMHQHDGNVDLLRDPRARSAAKMISLMSVGGALLAVTCAVNVPRSLLKALIAGIVLAAGAVTLATAGRRLRYRRSHMIALGAVAAFNKGLSGGGYGPLVTAGQVVSGLPAKTAVAVTSLAEALTCAVGIAGYLALGQRIDWTLAVPLTLGAMLSVPMATLTVQRLPERILRVAVGATTCLLGAFAALKMFA